MHPKTIVVRRAGHPDERVLINEDDFAPATDTLWTDGAAEPPAKSGETQAKPAKPAKPAKTR